MSSRSRIDAAIGGPQNPTPHTAIVRRPAALRVLRFLLLGCGVIAFAVGLWTGFARLGVGLTSAVPQFVEFHDAFMICGFFGTLISIERAAAFAVTIASVSGRARARTGDGASHLKKWERIDVEPGSLSGRLGAVDRIC